MTYVKKHFSYVWRLMGHPVFKTCSDYPDLFLQEIEATELLHGILILPRQTFPITVLI